MLVIDASDSMNETDAAGVVKIDAARQGLTEFERQLPEGTPVGLRRFGDDNCTPGTLLVAPTSLHHDPMAATISPASAATTGSPVGRATTR